MARKRSAPAQQPQVPPQAVPPGQVADTLGVATAAAAAPAAGGAVAAAAITAATAKIIGSLLGFFSGRRADDAIWLRQVLQADYPQRTEQQIETLVSDELQRQIEFERKMRERLERDLPKALAILDPAERQQAVSKVLDREKRYLAMRQQAMVERASARAEHMDVKAASPEGAFWALDPTVKKHTFLCLLYGQKAWPWSVLDQVHPVLHASCFPAGVVVDGMPPRGVTKRWWSGLLVELRLAGGRRLPVTPNHPILTVKGWVAAGELNEGSYVVSGGALDRPCASDTDDEDVPARIEEVFDSLLFQRDSCAATVPGASVDFHGDGMEGDVHVVRADGLLGDALESTRREERPKVKVENTASPDGGVRLLRTLAALFRSERRSSQPRLLGTSPEGYSRFSKTAGDSPSLDPVLVRERLDGRAGGVFGHDRLDIEIAQTTVGIKNDALTAETAQDDVGCGVERRRNLGAGLAVEVTLRDLLVRFGETTLERDARRRAAPPDRRAGHAEPLPDFGFGQAVIPELLDQSGVDVLARPWPGDSSLTSTTPDGAQGDWRAARDALQWLAGDVTLDRVVEVRRIPWSGHVYNLDTGCGWYTANGIVVHNCKCHLLPLGDAKQRGFLPQDHKIDAADAIKTARSWMSRYGTVEAVALPDEIELFVEERLEEAACGPGSPQTCCYCEEEADRSLVWDEGRAFAPVCSDHAVRAAAEILREGSEVVEIVEAEYTERLHPRDRKGRWVRKPIERALRALTPSLKGLGEPERRAPLQERGSEQGRYVWLKGRYVFVPRGREFSRRIDHVLFTSPAGSTNIYRNGHLVQIEGKPPPPHHEDLTPPAQPDIRNLPGVGEYHPARDQGVKADPGVLTADQADAAFALAGSREEHRLMLDERVERALAQQNARVPPVEPGDYAGAAADMLTRHGFREGVIDQVGHTLRLPFDHFASGARVVVEWQSRGDHDEQLGWRLTKVDWTPGRSNWNEPPQPLDHPPLTWEQFADEVRGVAYRLAAEHHLDPVIGEVNVATKEQREQPGAPNQYSDHSGSHNSYTGMVTLGTETPDVLLLAKGTEQGVPPGEHPMWHEPDTGVLRSAWASYKVGVHEALHGAGNVIDPRDYRGEGKVLEEALVEELAHVEAVKLIRAHGADNVLGWLRTNPLDGKAQGSYSVYRRRLDILLNLAKVAPELREDYLRDLRWNYDTNGRIEKLAADVEAAQGADAFPDGAELAVHDILQSTGENSLRDAEFVPILRPDLSDFPSPDGVIWDGKKIGVGTVIEMQSGERVNGRWRKTTTDAQVLSIERANQPGFKFKMTVRTEGRIRHNVLDSQVVGVIGHMERDRQGDASLLPGVDLYGPDVGIGGKRATIGARVRLKEGLGAMGGPGRELVVVGHQDAFGQYPPYLLGSDPEHPNAGTFPIPYGDAEVLKEGPEAQRANVGEVIRYDGRADGGYSEAVVTAVHKLTQFSSGTQQPYMIEATTTENSLKPGVNVVLTPERMSGVSVVPGSNVVPIRPEPIATVDTRPRYSVAADPGDDYGPEVPENLRVVPGVKADQWSKLLPLVQRWEAGGVKPGGEKADPGEGPSMEEYAAGVPAAIMAADLVPTDWRVEHGYGEWVPNVGFRYIPYKPILGGMEEKAALAMLHHYFTGSTDGWTGSRKQKAEIRQQAAGRWAQHMTQQGWMVRPRLSEAVRVKVPDQAREEFADEIDRLREHPDVTDDAGVLTLRPHHAERLAGLFLGSKNRRTRKLGGDLAVWVSGNPYDIDSASALTAGSEPPPPVLEALGVPEEDREQVAAMLLALPAAERTRLVEEWLARSGQPPLDRVLS